MENLLLLRNLLIALALGAFIGLEREYARYKKRGHDYAGIRTFPLIALFGALAAFFSDLVSPWIFFISILLMGVLILLAYVFSNKGKLPHIGATSEVAGFLTFFIGALSYYGEILLAIILTIAITIILYARSLLHQLAEHIQPKEMASVIKFLVITFIILPLLPNRWYGPYDIINPYLIWLMVVLISGIGFVGYIALKWFGEKALSVTGVLGGLASSTAVTMQFARRSKKEAALSRALATGVILANGVMFLRVLLVTAVVNLALFWSLFLPLAGLILLTAIFGYVLLQKMKKKQRKDAAPITAHFKASHPVRPSLCWYSCIGQNSQRVLCGERHLCPQFPGGFRRIGCDCALPLPAGKKWHPAGNGAERGPVSSRRPAARKRQPGVLAGRKSLSEAGRQQFCADGCSRYPLYHNPLKQVKKSSDTIYAGAARPWKQHH